jgi:Holliday junction resolvase RusA-like endonuclease
MTPIHIPLEPYAKERPRRSKAGRFYTPRETVTAEKAVRAVMLERRQGDMMLDPVKVTANFHMTHQRGDLDNYLKLIFDAANGVLWKDDRQIKELHATIDLVGVSNRPCTVVSYEWLEWP